MENNKWNIKQFCIINLIAGKVYNAIQGGNDQNFYFCYKEYGNGIFGWIKEKTAFDTAIEIYEEMTANEAWDIIAQIDEDNGESFLEMLSVKEINEYRQKYQDVE